MAIKNKGALLAISALFILGACSQSPKGAGTKALDKTFKELSFQRTVYSQSMIRAAANVANLDSNHLLTQDIEYFLQFKIEKKTRFYSPKADSTVLWNLANDGLETMASYESSNNKMFLFLKNEDDVIRNLVFVRSDSANFELMEFVGEMKMKTLIAEGWTNIQNFENILNLNLFPATNGDSKND